MAVQKCKQTEKKRFNEFVKALRTFRKNCKKPNSRYKSWEYCYEQFYRARKRKHLSEKDYDFLSLHLAFYLSSWGMLRNSFLLECDYKIHISVIKEILNPRYQDLVGVKCSDIFNEKDDKWDCLEELIKKIRSFYWRIRKKVYKKKVVNLPEKDVSDVLITKVLMGTLGCVPAYDRFFKEAIAGKENLYRDNDAIKGALKRYIAPSKFGKNSMTKLVEFYERHNSELESIRKKMKMADIEYPQMKLLDMGFWQLGFDAEQRIKKKKD